MWMAVRVSLAWIGSVVLVGSMIMWVQAAPGLTEPVSARLAGSVAETAKVILPETSIDGPGFTGSEIAWTGTDAAHHLNLRTGSTDGLHFPNKTILPETSLNGPAITQVIDRGTEAPVVLAWTDANHLLNVQLIPGGTKLTLHETSLGAPAIDFLNNPNGSPDTPLLAWTGTDANHSLNVMPITGSVPGKKTVLSQFSSDAGPSLIGNLSGTGVIVLGWSVRGTQRLNLAESSDGVHFTSALGSGLPETSATAPQFGFVSSQRCIAWTGTDTAHHLNVQCTTQFPQFPDPAHTKTELSEAALGAPGFAVSAIAWTGTDAAHSLNVAKLQLP